MLKRTQGVISIGIAAAIGIALVKGIAYAWTGSQAVFADWIESIVHIWITLLVALSLWYSAKPPDHEHRYGHGKITYFTAALEGLLIISAGIGTLYSSIQSLWHPLAITALGAGIFLECAMVVVNGMVGRYLVRMGRVTKNLALIANGQHVLTDMWTTAGLVISLVSIWLTGWHWLDVIVGAAISLNIMWMGFKLCQKAYQGLMERADERVHTTILAILDQAVKEHFLGDYHQLRHRRINDCIWIEVHMLFDGELTLQEAHRRATIIEVQVIDSLSDDITYITSHLEPLSHREAHPANHPESSAKIPFNKDALF